MTAHTSHHRRLSRPSAGRLRGLLRGLGVAIGLLAAPVSAAEPPSGGAHRVVSLAPSVTETIFALGAEDRLVAVSSYCDFPPAAAGLPRAGSYLQPNVEAILGFEPDLVLGVPTPGNRAAVEQLRRLGLAVVMVSEDTVADAWSAMRTVGKWVGRSERAEELIARVQAEIEAVRRAAESRPRKRVLFVVGHDPLVAAGDALFLDELIDAAGGENVGAIGRGSWPRLSLETVVAAGPEVIIDGAMGTESSAAGEQSLLAWWEPYRSVPAVREGRVRAQRSNALLRPGPRLGVAARELFALVQGEPAPTPGPTPGAVAAPEARPPS